VTAISATGDQLGSNPLDGVTPRLLFQGLSDEEWEWLLTHGTGRCPFLHQHLPSLPSQEFQASITGMSGTTALAVGSYHYTLFKTLYQQHRRRPLAASDHVLDFGCGWGRVTRFFLKDVDPENLWGVDINEAAIDTCSHTDRWSHFATVPVLPPCDLSDSYFDLVYAYSVFSHLSEEAHLAWLKEFDRILNPGGMLLLTTLPRAFIEASAEFSGQDAGSLQGWQRHAAAAFSPVEEWLNAYDDGRFCYTPIDKATNPHFGFSCIPESYFRSVWSQHMQVLDYLPAEGLQFQDLIVCTKR
jgi:ubiquinone/menaquinone biosynthesis C-methylase UbiE